MSQQFLDILQKKSWKCVYRFPFNLTKKIVKLKGDLTNFLTKNFKILIFQYHWFFRDLKKKSSNWRWIRRFFDNFSNYWFFIYLKKSSIWRWIWRFLTAFVEFLKFFEWKKFVKWKIIPHFNKLSRFFQRFFKINNSLVLVQAVPRVLLGTPQVSSTSFSKVQFRMLY